MNFQDESEEYISQTWRKVALCHKDMKDQLKGYQSAIEALAVRNKFVDTACMFKNTLLINNRIL